LLFFAYFTLPAALRQLPHPVSYFVVLLVKVVLLPIKRSNNAF
jgi:hypothetical protein